MGRGGELVYFHIIRVYEGMDNFGRFKILNKAFLFFFFIFIWKGGGVRKFNIYGESGFCGYFLGAHFYAFTGVFLSPRHRAGIHL